MNDIIYETETARDVVFEGDLTLDGHMTPAQQRQSIFDLMKEIGIPIEEDGHYEIGYDGASDNNGISETQTTHFVVTKVYEKQVPFLLNREPVFEGDWVLDGLRITPEEQRRRIFEEARKKGVEIANENEYEIGFDGAEDQSGVSETQTSHYVVYHVTKKQLSEEELRDYMLHGSHQKEYLQNVHEELMVLRELAKRTNDPEEIARIATQLEEISTLLDSLVDDSTRDYAPFERALAEVEKQIEEIQNGVLENMRAYDESYERMKQLLKDQTETIENSQELVDFDERIREIMNEKQAENADSYSIHEIIDKQLAELKKLVKKKDKIRRDFEMAKELGISAYEFRELSDNFRSRKLVNAILEKKGLGDIIAIPAKDRTPEQKRRIRTVRREVLEELARMKQENEDKSVLKLVEALYGIETEVKLKGKQRILLVKEGSLERIRKNAQKMPEKIPGKDETASYQPGETPDDMKPVLEKRAEDERAETAARIAEIESLRRVVLYRDSRFPGKYFAPESVIAEFNLLEEGDPIVFGDDTCFEIGPDDVDYIISNATNEEDPYLVEVRSYPKVKEKAPEGLGQIPYNDAVSTITDEPFAPRGLMDQLTVFIDENNKYYVRKPAFARFDVEPIGEEVRLDGTAGYEINPEDVRRIVENQNNDVSPYSVIFRPSGRYLEKGPVKEDPPIVSYDDYEGARGLKDQLTVFIDEDGKYYVRKPAFDRFDVRPVGEEVRLHGAAGGEISVADVHKIVDHQNNDVSPYDVVFRKIEFDKNKENPPVVEEPRMDSVETPPIVEEDVPEDEFIPGTQIKKPRERGMNETDEEYVEYLKNYYDSVFNQTVSQAEDTTQKEDAPQKTLGQIPYDDSVSTIKEEGLGQIPYNDAVSTIKPKEVFTIYRNQDNPTEFYARKYVFERFDKEPIGEGIRVAGALCYPIAAEDVQDIDLNANNSYSPYEVVYMDISLTSEKKPVEDNPEVVHDKVEDAMHNEQGLTDQMTVFIDEDNKYYVRKPVFERFDVEPKGSEVRLDGTAGHEIDIDDLRDIVANQDNDYSPYHIVYRKAENHLQKPEPVKEDPPIVSQEEYNSQRGLTDQVSVYIGEDNKYYVRKPVFERFDVEPIGEEVRLGGVAGYEIGLEDLRDIVENQNNDVSPYRVIYRRADFPKKEETKETPPVVEESQASSDGPVEQIRVFIDEDGKYYVRKPVFERFDAEPIGEEVRLGGVAGHEISMEDLRDIVENQNNPVSPYRVLYSPVKIETKKKTPTKKKPEETEETEKEETITLFRDVNDNLQVYAPDDVLQNFGIKTLAEPTMVQDVPCHKISRDTDQIINSIAKMSHNPKLVIRYIDLPIKELEEVKPRPHVEEILDKITSGLDIRAKDAKRYNASNIRVGRGFVDELRSGNYAYNIVHIVPASLKAGVGFFRKLGGNLMTTARARESMESIEKRLSNLSEEELEVLFEEYKGSQLKTDMNNQINPLVLERLRNFGLQRVATLNDRIQKDYVSLFTLLGQIKALEDKMKAEEESSSLESQRQAYMKEASEHVQAIIQNRKKANDLLSSGIHGLEEDFKAVSTKLSYVGMRFAKTNDFDNDLQHKLGELGRKLNTALAAGDDEAIVQNFMGLETCYYENTEIRGSLAGKRSVGTKYYSPVAEQFDYRDDPFIRDLFTTIAVTSAAVSAVNAIRVHQIESQSMNDEVAKVNAENQATMDQVHQTASEISGKRETFQEGMEAQAQQDILTNADVRERAHLDLTNWKFNDAYHAADHAGHAAYNQFGIDVNNQINAVTTDYAQGLINEAQALERMAQISSNAQATLRDVVDSSLTLLRDYAATHPQFDLSAVEKSMEYIVQHPTAIADMNQAMVDVTNLADGLQGLQASEMAAIGTLPSDMASTLVCAASAVLLATNVSNSMGKAPKKGTYGNEITEMMEEYINGSTPEAEDEKVAAK